jgi:hypothetical protein
MGPHFSLGMNRKHRSSADYELIYSTNADYIQLGRDLGLFETEGVFEKDRDLLEYIEMCQTHGKGESQIYFSLREYPGLKFQLSPKSTLNVFIYWNDLKRLFEPLMIVKDKVLKPKEGYGRIELSLKDVLPLGKKATYKFMRSRYASIMKEWEKKYKERPLGMYSHSELLRYISHYFLNYFNLDCIFYLLESSEGIELGYELEREDLIEYENKCK